MAIGMVRSARSSPGTGTAGTGLVQVAADAESAARIALAASMAAGNPISQRQLMTRFGEFRGLRLRDLRV
jgi:hypothetical protein